MRILLLTLLAFALFWQHPFPANAANEVTIGPTVYVTSEFGWRTHPISGEQKFHSGVDLAADYGTQIPAIYSGTVVAAGFYEGYGNAVVLQHEDNSYTLYGHCSELCVTVGQHVNAGDVIALVGSTGYSTGPHLHLELWRNGEYVNPLSIWQMA